MQAPKMNMKPSTTLNTIETPTGLSGPVTTTHEDAPVFTAPDGVPKGPVGIWEHPAIIAPNNFKFKSLSNWALNIAIGCSHACRFCSVPSTSTKWQSSALATHGINDPDAEWGKYVLLRPWDEKKFLASLRSAESTPEAELKSDGNRAVILCSTTDAYQVIHHSDPEQRRKLNAYRRYIVRRSLELIRDHSTLNVRILTRSPLAREDFDIYKSLGDRLMFGMSLPTLDNKLSKFYEPNAPAPSQRLATLQAAKKAGLNIFVAVAPTYAECDGADLHRTLTAIKALDPLTVFHEPINIRAENVQRIQEHTASLGVQLNTDVFATPVRWREYALESLFLVENLAQEIGLSHCLHLWPDKSLGSENAFLELRQSKRSHLQHTNYEKHKHEQDDRDIYQNQLLPWLNRWWNRISEWPGNK
jgi:DNA repair photolyase